MTIVDRCRHKAVLHCQCRNDRFQCPAGTKQVSGHGFRTGYIRLHRCSAKRLFHSQRFTGIIERRAGSMRIDIINIRSCNSSILDCHGHGTGRLCSIRKRCRNMIGITGAAIPDDLPIDFRISGKRMLQLLQNQHTGSLSHNEALAFRVEGNRSTIGILSLMQCPHTRKSCHCHRCYCRFTSPRSHHILIAVTNAVEGFSNGVGCRRTGSHHTGYIAVCIHINGSTSR